MTAGRPTEYDAIKTAKAVSKYLSDCKRQFYLPTIEGLAVHLGVWRSTLYDWAAPSSDVYHVEFHDIFEQLKALQASMLIQNGLKGEYNATITKLLLTKHNYSDKQETDIKSDGKAIVFMPGEIADKNGITMDATNTSTEGHS